MGNVRIRTRWHFTKVKGVSTWAIPHLNSFEFNSGKANEKENLVNQDESRCVESKNKSENSVIEFKIVLSNQMEMKIYENNIFE